MWCGKGSKPKGYDTTGNSYQCLQMGFGAGMHSERNKNLPADSLQRIKYVGEKMEARFKRNKIKTMSQLVSTTKKMTVSDVEKLLKKILKKTDGSLDGRAYNSTILYLHSKKVKTPQCKDLF